MVLLVGERYVCLCVCVFDSEQTVPTATAMKYGLIQSRSFGIVLCVDDASTEVETGVQTREAPGSNEVTEQVSHGKGGSNFEGHEGSETLPCSTPYHNDSCIDSAIGKCDFVLAMWLLSLRFAV